MPERAEALVLQMSADIRRMEKALAKISGDTDRQLGRTEKRFDKLNDHIKRSGDQMARDLRGAFATIGVSVAIREVATYADAWTTASNKLASAGVEQNKLAATMQDLVDLSQETRQNFSDTVALYSRLTIAGQKLGLTQEQVRRVTELTSKAFVAGGATAQEQAAGIIQLGQALSSGFLQGDELRSIRENAPLLAQAIADEFGVAIGELKQLGAEGELTSARVAKAILNANGITDRFEKTVTTLAQAMENLRTEFTRYIAESRIAQTVISALGGFIQFVTDNIDLLADAAIVAASVIGGTLAVQAIGRFVASLKTARLEAANAGKQFLVLRTAMSFLGGPVGAIILGLGVALGSMALGATETKDAMEEANAAISNLSNANEQLKADTDELASAQARLTRAIETNSAAAQNAAIADIEAIRRRIEANKQLALTERVRLNESKIARERQYRDQIPDNLNGPLQQLFGLTGQPGSGAIPLQEAVRLMQGTFQRSGKDSSIEGIRSEIARQSAAGPLNEQFQVFFDILQRYDQYQADMKSIQDAIAAIDAATGASFGDLSIDFPSLPEAKAAGQAISGYRTELEKLNDTLRALSEARRADGDTESQAFMAYDALLAQDPATDPAALQAMADKLRAVSEAMDGRELERSRQALEALITFMDSTSVRAAFDQLPSLSGILLGEDEALFRIEAEKRIKAVADGLATGIRRLEIDRDAAIAAASQGMADALGFDQAGFDAMSASARRALGGAADVYLDAIDQAWQDFNDGVADIVADRFTLDLSTPGLDGGDRMAGLVDQLDGIGAANQAGWVTQGIFPSEAQEEFRLLMRDSVKSAMREGIRTGDWDDAFKSILADAVTSGLEGALNRVGDWLADFLFAPDGFLGGLINGAGAFVGASIFGGTGRPTGGGVMAGGAYRVNDRADKGEFLFMGSNPGQVLRAADLNGMMTGRGGGGTIIQAGLTVMGSIDAVTLPKVQQMMNAQTQRIMSAMPTAVRGTIIHDRKQKRRY